MVTTTPARPPGRSTSADLAEVGRPGQAPTASAPSDRGDAVELALHVAVVDHPDLGPFGQALLEDALAGEVELFLEMVMPVTLALTSLAAYSANPPQPCRSQARSDRVPAPPWASERYLLAWASSSGSPSRE